MGGQTTRGRLSVAAICISMALAAAAQAQPDPFEDYDRGQRGSGQDAPAAGGDADVLRGAGALTLGLAGVFALTHTTGEGLDGSERTETTFFTRISPSVGFMLFDGLEFSFSPGLAWRRISRGEGETTTERAVLLRGGVRYQAPLDSRILGVVGVEIGGYVGGSERPLAGLQDGRVVDEATDTAGFTAAFELGLGVVLDPRTVLDLGLTVDYLTGSEDIGSQSASLASSLLHTGVRLGLRFFF